jgi:hypothetical protein
MNDCSTVGFLFTLAQQNKVNNLSSTAPVPKVHLIAEQFNPNINLDPTTLTEATFDGYAAATCDVWGTNHSDPTQQAVFTSGVLSWTPTGNTTANTIYGYYLVTGVGDVVQMGLLPAPVFLQGVGTTLAITITVPIAPPKGTVTLQP